MDDVVGKAWYELGTRDERLDADLRAAEGKVKASATRGADHYEKTYTTASQKVSAGFGTVRNSLAAIGIGIGLTTVMSFFGGAIGAASDLNEEVSKAGVVFGASAAKVEAFGDKADKALGQSKQQALAAAGGFGNMFRTIGFADDSAADMSMTMVQLASDMASFNNQDPSDMLIRLRSGLAGEAEPLRTFGVLLSEARVKEEAYAAGIAVRGAALTEAQKVQARYSLILKDTSLQQGDFARTSTGLANSQRIQAAVMENSMARIGAALLPLAKALTQFATEVLPGVADGITSLLNVAAPMLSLFLALAKVWLEHANVVLPLLVAMIGLKLVGSYLKAAEAAKLAGKASVAAGLAAKAAWSAALLGLPVLVEALSQGADAAGNFLDELVHGKEGAKVIRDLVDIVGHGEVAAKLYAWGVAASDFQNVMDITGTDVQGAFRLIEDSADHSAQGVINAFLKASREAARGEIGKQTAAKLREGAPEVAAGAKAGITDPITAAANQAREDAVAAARKMPAEIAAAIIEGRDEVLTAGEGLVQAALDPLLQEARITELRAQMKDLATVTADELKAATPATVAADKLKYATMEIQLAAYLLRADPMSKEAAGLLAKYFNSGDPATQLALDTMLTAAEKRAFIMANDIESEAERAGIAPEEAFKRHHAAATTAAMLLAAGVANRVREKLGDTLSGDAGDWGLKVAIAFANGLGGGGLYVAQKTLDLAGSVKRYLQGMSPPREGPLHEIDRWGHNLGKVLGDNFAKGMSASGFMAAMGGPQLALAGAGGGQLPAAAAPGRGDTIYQLHYNGRQESFTSPYDAIDRLTELGLFSEGRIAR